MTAFPATIPKIGRLADEFDDTSTRDKINRTVAAGRSTRPEAVTEMRARPRYSIDEIDDLDWDQVRERLSRTAFDNRGPVTRFLDLIDLPRNTIAGILAPGVRRRKEAEGEMAALGQGRVYFSDILGELGMRPGLVRGVLGFVGDVATDPLTYAGPPGWGAKLTSTGGRAVRVGAQGMRAARSAIKAVETGGVIADDLTRSVAEHVFSGLHPAAGNAEKAEALATALFGDAATGIRKRLKTGQIFERRGAGSKIAESIERPLDEANAPYREWLNRYGEGFPGELADAAGQAAGVGGLTGGLRIGPKGIGFGNAQSAVAHIPFTEIGVYVPGFTGSARMRQAARVASLVRTGEFPAVRALLDTDQRTREFGELLDRTMAWQNRHELDPSPPLYYGINTRLGIPAETIEGVETGSVRAFIDPNKITSPADYDIARPYLDPVQRRGVVQSNLTGMSDALRAKADEMYTLAHDNEYAKGLTAQDLLHLQQRSEVAKAAVRMVQERAAAVPFNRMMENAKASGGAYRSARDEAQGAIVSAAESELELPMLRDRLSLLAPEDPGRGVVERVLHARTLELPGKVKELADKDDAFRGLSRIASLSDDDLKLHESVADALHRSLEAQSVYANAVRGSMIQTMTDGEKHAADFAHWLLGFDPDSFKPGPLMSMLNASRAAFGGNDYEGGLRLLNATKTSGQKATQSALAFDRGWRGFFGDRGSFHDNLRRNVETVIETGAPFETQAAVNETILPAMKRAADDFGLKTPEQRSRFLALVEAQRYADMHELDPTRLPGFVLDRESGKMVEAPYARLLRESVESGLLKDPAVKARVAELSRMITEHYEAMAPRSARELYSPIRLTPEYARAAAAKRADGYNVIGSPKPGVNAADTLRAEHFEQPRTTDFYQWRDAEGKWHQEHEFDFNLAERYAANPEELAALPSDHQATIGKLQEELESFRQMHPGLDKDRRWMVARTADPFYLNEHMKSRFAAITGGSKIAEQMFSDNALYLLMRRQSEQFRAAAKRSFQSINEAVGIDSNSRVVSREDFGPLGKGFGFADGKNGMVIGGAGRQPVVQIGEQFFRPINVKPEALAEPGLMSGVLDTRGMVRLVPEQWASMVERAAEAGSGESLNQIVNFADRFTSLWKSLTLAHPSWPIFNVVGMAWQAAMGRIPLDAMMRRLRDAWQVTLNRGRLHDLEGEFTFAGRPKPKADVAIETNGQVGGSGQSGEVIRQRPTTSEIEYPGFTQPGLKERVATKFPRLAEEFKKRMALHLDQWEAERAPTAWDKLKVSAKMLADETYVRRVLRPFFRMNAIAEDWIRTAGYMALLDSGMSPAQAAARTREVFYDFNNLTRQERAVRRFAIPFYSWLRSNGAYQLSNVLTNPKWAAMVPKLKEALEEAIAGEDQVPEHLRPSWMRDQLAIQLGGDPDSRTSLAIGTAINTEPVNVVGGALAGGTAGAMNLVKWLTSGLNPAASIPLQLGAGRETFTGRTIGASPGEGDLTAGEFLLGQVRPLRELAPIGPRTPPLVKSFQEGVGSGVARLALGGRAQSFTQERLDAQRAREFNEKADAIKKYIRVAEKNGDHAASLDGRVRLLKVYEAMQKQGLKVPKWAKGQLSSALPAP